MRKQIVFQDDMEALAADENAIEAYVQGWGDELVNDWLLNGRAYSGFPVTRVHSTQITIGPGRLYDTGRMFGRDQSATLDLTPYLPAVGGKILAVVANGQTTDQLPVVRNFLIDVETGAQQPRQVYIEKWREALLGIQAGAEAPSPVKPAILAGYTVIAWVTISPTGLAAQSDIQMEPSTEIANLTDAFAMLLIHSDWITRFNQDIQGLQGEIAIIKRLLESLGSMNLVLQLAADMARLKEAFGIPDARVDYHADRFLTTDESGANWPGYNALVEEGVRFPPMNEDIIVPVTLNPFDPNVKISPGGLMLPLYDEAIQIAIGDQVKERDAELRIAQYATATFGGTSLQLSRIRQRYGEQFVVCNNHHWWKQGEFDAATGIFQKDGETLTIDNPDLDYPRTRHTLTRLTRYFLDLWKEPWWLYNPTPRTITGKLIAETFQLATSFWLTSIDLYFNKIGAAGDVSVLIVETKDGKPDLDRILAFTTVTRANLVAGWTNFPIEPYFVVAGIRYAVLVVTVGDHYFAISTNNDFRRGTFFYAVDDDYEVVDPRKDLCYRLKVAKFRQLRTVTEMQPWNLDGGIGAIDIIMPGVFSDQGGGSGNPVGDFLWQYRIGSTWHSVAPPDIGLDVATPLAALPPLIPIRAVYNNKSEYVCAGVQLATTQVRISRPKTTMRHVSTPIGPLAGASDDITVQGTIANWNGAQHTMTCKILHTETGLGAATTLNPATVTDVDLGGGRLQRTWAFTMPSSATWTFRLQFDGSATSANNVPVLEERVDIAH